ncbi:MAG: type II toxin-antitoxin system Phd/YefM family antitoxin [Candidatus Methylomirabilota bacterium]|jgi:prevent-host-death family protein
MKIAPVADVKARLSKYLEECAEGPVVVTKNGRPTAVLVAVTDEEELERLILAHTPRFAALLNAAHDRIKKSGGVRHDDFWKTMGKKRL